MNWDLMGTGSQEVLEIQNWSATHYVPVIAEIGINHNGDIQLAKRLIQMAHSVGCDAVKFQKRTVDVVYSRDQLDAPRDSPWGTTQRDQKLGLEFGTEEYDEIDAFCRQLGIDWTASAWDLQSLEFVEAYDPPFHKVASAMTTHSEFVSRVAELGRPAIVSTGMADLEVLDNVVRVFQAAHTPLTLMHTVSTYPAQEADLNLNVMRTLRERYRVPVGYSGHESSVSPSIIAVALGARVIERHITIDRTMYGSDQAASLEESGLRQLVSTVRKIPAMMGDGNKRWAPGEADVARKLRYWEAD